MASNPMQRKVRNSFILGILVMLIVTILIGVIVFFVVLKPKMDQKKLEESKLYAYAYRLKKGVDVKSGEEITGSMVESVEIEVETATTDFVPAKRKDAKGNIQDVAFASGYTSKIDLKEGTILTYSMLNEGEEKVANSLRHMEYSMITMPTTLSVGDYVDVRLRIGNGQDLIVIPKKQVTDIYGQTVGFNLTEEEILILNSAIVESYIMTSASELYLAKYVEPGIQTASSNTYMPTNEVISLMNINTNILNEAKQALGALYSDEGVRGVRDQINSTVNSYGEDKNDNIKQGLQEQIEAARKAREDYLSELENY